MDVEPGVFVIDCPMGRFMFGAFLSRGIVKDLACLDKVGSKALSRADRLRFYLSYSGKRRLADKDKRRIHRVLSFFKGRE